MLGKYKDKSPLVKTFQWLGMMAVCGIALMIVYACIPNRESVNGLKLLQLLQGIGVLLVPAIVVACWWSEQPWQWLHVNRAPSGKGILLATCVMVVALPGLNLLSWVNQQMVLPSFLSSLEAMMKAMEERAMEMTQMFLQMDSFGSMITTILLMAFLPALSEEFTFRGVMQGLMSETGGNRQEGASRQRHVTAVWVTAIVFSAIHFQFYGFLPRMLMGALFGYVLLWSGNLWIGVWMHFVNNAAVICMYYYAQQTQDINTMDTLGTGDTLWLGIVSIVAAGAMIALLRQHLRKATTPPLPL